jgi:hypothetical protein
MVHCVSESRTLSKLIAANLGCSDLINLPCLAGGLSWREAGRRLQKLKIVLLFCVVENDANRVAHSAPHAADTVP